MDFTFIHAADIHLDSPMRGLPDYEGAPRDEVATATRTAFVQLVTDAIEREVDLMVMPGDVFDGSVSDSNAWLFFRNQLARLTRAQIPVVMISGNHDAESLVAREMRVPDGVTLLSSAGAETVSFAIGGGKVAVHGRSYPKKVVTEDLSSSYPPPDQAAFNIGLLHTCADPARTTHPPYAPCDVEQLARHGYQYWALGHVHDFHQFDTPVPVVFSGVLQGRQVRETGPKGYVLVTVEGGEVESITHVPINVVRWEVEPVDCTGLEELDELRSCIADAIIRARAAVADTGCVLALRLRLEGECGLHVALAERPDDALAIAQSLAGELGDDVLYIEQVKVRTSVPVDLSLLEEGAAALVLDQIANIGSDADVDAELARAFAKLRGRLPVSLVGLATVASSESPPVEGDDVAPVAGEDLAAQVRDYVAPVLARSMMEVE